MTSELQIYHLPQPSEYALMKELAGDLLKSGFLPSHIKRPEQAIAIMIKARELRIPAMEGLGSIYWLEGKLTLAADLMAGLVYRAIDEKGDGYFIVDSTPERCVVSWRRWGKDQEPGRYTFTWEDAIRAGAAGRKTYQQHPGSMLRARAIGHVCRFAFADVCAGMYVPEELEREEDRGLDQRTVLNPETGEVKLAGETVGYALPYHEPEIPRPAPGTPGRRQFMDFVAPPPAKDDIQEAEFGPVKQPAQPPTEAIDVPYPPGGAMDLLRFKAEDIWGSDWLTNEETGEVEVAPESVPAVMEALRVLLKAELGLELEQTDLDEVPAAQIDKVLAVMDNPEAARAYVAKMQGEEVTSGWFDASMAQAPVDDELDTWLTQMRSVPYDKVDQHWARGLQPGNERYLVALAREARSPGAVKTLQTKLQRVKHLTPEVSLALADRLSELNQATRQELATAHA